MTVISSSLSHLAATALPAPQILEIVGADAVSFAQAQFSSNLSELENGQWQWSAWLSAQGRVRAFFHLLRDDDQHLRVVLRGGSAAALRDALGCYVLRAKVQLRAPENVTARIEWLPATAQQPSATTSARPFERHAEETRVPLPGSAPRCLVLDATGAMPSEANDTQAALNESRLADIDAGLITLDPSLEDKLLPTWIGLDALGATSTSKGCYPGQEIVARLHFKGGNKRRLHRLTFSAEQLPDPGTKLGSTEGEAGLVVCAAWTALGSGAALAVLSEGSLDGMKHLDASSITTLAIDKIFTN